MTRLLRSLTAALFLAAALPSCTDGATSLTGAKNGISSVKKNGLTESRYVEGTAVSILIVGVTPEGQLAGVRTIAIWT